MRRWMTLLVVTAGLLATGLAWVATSLIEAASQWVAAGGLQAAGEAASRVPLPGWLSDWVDPAWWAAAQALLRWAGPLVGDGAEGMAHAVSLLRWGVWLLWGLAMLGLLVAALRMHLLLAESQRGTRRTSLPSGESVSR